jgi:hypothetical protein
MALVLGDATENGLRKFFSKLSDRSQIFDALRKSSPKISEFLAPVPLLSDALSPRKLCSSGVNNLLFSSTSSVSLKMAGAHFQCLDLSLSANFAARQIVGTILLQLPMAEKRELW